MKYQIFVEKEAKKGLQKSPSNVQNKFYTWVKLVESIGLLEVTRIPGLHDEPLKGKRIGQRSIRLNQAWRAIYRTSSTGKITMIMVEEISKHEY